MPSSPKGQVTGYTATILVLLRGVRAPGSSIFRCLATMVSLFATSSKVLRKASKKRPRSEVEAEANVGTAPAVGGSQLKGVGRESVQEEGVDAGSDLLSSSCWTQLGLAPWIQGACNAMGFKRPTPVQEQCIPSILQGRDVMGCAETGSGKTAAFALPMLHRLSEDPYGVFGLVLTPTRELAIQIAEQFQALGAPLGLRHCVVIGGESMVQQAVELARRPHVVVATPGRLWDHLRGAAPPDLSKAMFLVLDEADRLFCDGFEQHLAGILAAMRHPRRQTLLFSATMTNALKDLKRLTRVQPVLLDLTRARALPASLQEEYLFVPAQVKMCYLIRLLQKLLLGVGTEMDSVRGGRGAKGAGEESGSAGPVKSAMVFVGTCQRCQEVAEVLLEAGLTAVSLHSVLSQKRRLAALGKFKSSLVRVLVSTDVASRGLDIPDVDLVINYDLPRLSTDYIHRVGRTARAGRYGRAVSMVTQYDVALLQGVEAVTGREMPACEEVTEEEVVRLLNPVAKATRVARMRLMEVGFDEQVHEHLERKKRGKKDRQRKRRRAGKEEGGD